LKTHSLAQAPRPLPTVFASLAWYHSKQSRSRTKLHKSQEILKSLVGQKGDDGGRMENGRFEGKAEKCSSRAPIIQCVRR